MIEIKKGDLVIRKEKNTITQFTDTADGLYLKFIDEVEIIIPVKLDAGMKAAIVAAANMPAKGFKIDLNNRKQPISVQME